MKKSDLKTGMLVQTRDGKWRITMLNTRSGDFLYGYTGEGTLGLSYFDDNLKRTLGDNAKFDVIKVLNTYGSDVIKGLNDNNMTDIIRNYTVLWEEESSKIKEVRDLINKLQTQLIDAKNELDKLKGN
jgi:hypothetical protein